MESAAPAGKRRRRLAWFAAALLSSVLVLRYGNEVAIFFETDAPSVSHGTPANGRLEHGKRLPGRGENFHAYSQLGTLLGRNAVDGRLRATIVDAYASLAAERPDSTYVYGETGWPSGGRFRPHRTHRNGLAADFFVPVLDGSGRPDVLPTHPFNLFGYGIEFDSRGHWHDRQVDYPSLAAHLRALAVAAKPQGLRIDVVILDNAMQDALFAAEGGAGLRRHMRFSRLKPWIRHDEHYHVVFVSTR